jgi:hypothetical protein
MTSNETLRTSPESASRSLWREAVRSAVFLPVRWSAWHVPKWSIVALLFATLLMHVVVSRLYVAGPAQFFWPALLAGWFVTVVAIGACWWLAPAAGTSPLPHRAPSAAVLFAVMTLQSLVLGALLLVTMVPWVRGESAVADASGGWAAWLAWGAPFAWSIGTAAALVWRGGNGSRSVRAGAIAAMFFASIASEFGERSQLWYPRSASDQGLASAEDAARFEWTPALLEEQWRTLPRRLDHLAEQRPGVVDLYTLTYAPFASEEVFRRESEMVSSVMATRFATPAHAVQLINHRSSAADWPWATPANLERAVAAIAKRMNPDEDVLFNHLTSHGARSGELSAEFWPFQIEALTPSRLKAALDAAGVRFRIISVSACYAGSWIAPLADDRTLVMTAADAEHTSYGCGRGSELTYFGRALYDEALREGLPFEAAFAKARRAIEQREKEAGKSDGYSNPQVHVGPEIRELLNKLQG